METVQSISRELKAAGNSEKAKTLARFFKTGKGQYGEGDRFYGVMVPQTRAIVAKHYKALSLEEISKLLHSPVHEERLASILAAVKQYEQGNAERKKKIFDFYLKNAKKVNNWDLVDLSAPNIVGAQLNGKGKETLKRLAQSENLWERRIAMLSTYHTIKKGESKEAFMIADVLMHDAEDLIHKAVGWMLREVGKRASHEELERYLKPRYQQMPRTMLRYAIERFPETRRKAYLMGNV